MRFQRIVEQVYFQPWYITTAGHASIHAILASRLGLMALESPAAAAPGISPRGEISLADFVVQRQPMKIDREGIATIQVLGPLARGLSKIEKSCGATDFADIQQEYRDAVQAGAKGLILDMNTPGGTVSGTPETADLIASKQIPTVVLAEELVASAGMYLAAGADYIVGGRSAMVGSIGVYIPWMDYSARLTALGYKPDPIVNEGGDLKALGFGGSLTDAQRAFLQDSVNQDFAAFKSHVRAFRAVPDQAMRGQVLKGQAALDAALIDEIGGMAEARAKLQQLIKARRN